MRQRNDEKPRCAATQRGSNIQNGEVSADEEKQKGTAQSRASAHDAVLLRFDALAENAATLQSLSISLGEACFRQSETMVGVHLRQIRLALNESIRSYKEIIGLTPGCGGEK